MQKTDLESFLQGSLHDPFRVLGWQREGAGWRIREYVPGGAVVEIGGITAAKVPGRPGLFEILVDDGVIETHYPVSWREPGADIRHRVISPYTFLPQVAEADLHLFGEGRHHHAYRFLGAHPAEIDGVDGVQFAVWAPGARRVAVVGDFNGWHGLRHTMRVRGASGVFELFIPGLRAGDSYKFEIAGPGGQTMMKADPYARRMTLRPDTACRVADNPGHAWNDRDWLERRKTTNWLERPVSIYELHPGSWRRGAGDGFIGFRELADRLVPYLLDAGFTHVELMPVMEHPLDESWGYQVSGYYAPSARFGDPDDLRYLVDACHGAGIGVILDWVPGHFPRDEFALARFVGEPLYEHADPRRGEHRDWGTLIFDYGRNEVGNFLLSNAVYWIEEFHVDGLRVDAVASMLYLDYSRGDDWLPNRYGGRENLEAIDFLRRVNEVLHSRFPGVLTIAEESTAWPMVSRPPEVGGLGFSMKWNMGWMNDTLDYFSRDPVYRRYHHDRLTFSQMYAYSENFVLPLSHDEVVHLKGSLLGKMPGDEWQRFANLRLLLAWQFAHPGKKLLFMGGELGAPAEWSEAAAVDWSLLDRPAHAGIRRLVADLNRTYAGNESLHRFDCSSRGFRWIDCHDQENSVLAFERLGGEPVVCVFNFTPVVREGYRIGVPAPGAWREMLNTDAVSYGGSNVGNAGRVEAAASPWMDYPASLSLTLPPLAALLLRCEVGA